MRILSTATCLLLLSATLFAAGPAPGKPAPQGPLTADEYQKGLAKLRKYLDSRGEKAEDIDAFINDLRNIMPPPRDVFTAFLDYEAAWARKTRDSKNPQVSKAQLAHEVERANELKNKFKQLTHNEAPAFLTAFQGAVKDVRAQRASRSGGQPGESAGSFSDTIDNSFTQVDAGDEALQNGDPAAAASDAQAALNENPGNADAAALLAGAQYAQGDMTSASQSAQAALSLDPTNQQAQAVADLANAGPMAAPNVAADAQAVSQSLAGGAAEQNPGPAALPPINAYLDAPSALPALPPATAPATPALAARLSADLTARAQRTIGLGDASSSLPMIDRALNLDPTNTRAWNVRSAIASRSGDYSSALASADKAISIDPKNGRGFFSRARAYAVKGDRTEMIDALRQAAALDVKYEQKLESALALPTDADLKLLFPKSLDAAPAPPPSTHAALTAFKFLAAIGALLVLLAFLSLIPEKKKRR